MALAQRSNLSKLALGDGHGENSPYFDGWKAYDADPFHPTHNPHGVIQMGLAENQLCLDMIQEWIINHPTASICTSQGVYDFKQVAIFQDYHGLPEFQTAVAKFMSKVRGNKVTFDPDRIVMAGGATGAHESIAFCLADPGDAFLIPTPYYPGFDRDLKWRTGLQIMPIHCHSANNFQLTMPAVELAYKDAVSSKIRVKGILITNPSNPLGTSLNRATLEELLRFSVHKRIHLVCDEIYAATLPSETSTFLSISEVLEEWEKAETENAREFIHVVYSLSKDMGLPGFRVGVVYSYNDAVLTCARRMSSFSLVSTQTQRLVARMLSDNGFIDRFLLESAIRLTRRRKALETELATVGIPCLKADAGLFSWMDIRGLLDEATVEGEMALWRVILREVKLNVSPGSSFHCSEPGWFRVCFANMDEHTLQVALWRIHNFMATRRDNVVGQATKWFRSDRLQISLSFRRTDDINMCSPSNSPLPRSPLIPTRT